MLYSGSLKSGAMGGRPDKRGQRLLKTRVRHRAINRRAATGNQRKKSGQKARKHGGPQVKSVYRRFNQITQQSVYFEDIRHGSPPRFAYEASLECFAGQVNPAILHIRVNRFLKPVRSSRSRRHHARYHQDFRPLPIRYGRDELPPSGQSGHRDGSRSPQSQD